MYNKTQTTLMLSARFKFQILSVIALMFTTHISAQVSDSNYSITALSSFAKSYGYIRYFYPEKDLIKVDWNNFLDENASDISRCKSNAELIDRLNHCIGELAPLVSFGTDSNFISIKRNSNKRVYQKEHIGFGDAHLVGGSKLFTFVINKFFIHSKTKINKLRYTSLHEIQTRDNGFRTYRIDSNVYMRFPTFLFLQERKPILNYYIKDSENSCFSNVAIIWNVFRHFFPYFSPERSQLYDDNLKKYISKSFEAKTLVEKDKLYRSIPAFLKDGHCNVAKPDNIIIKNNYSPKFGIALVNNKIYVTWVAAEINDKIKTEDEIVSIDSKNISQLVDSIQEFNSIPGQGVLRYRIRIALFGEENSSIAIKIVRHGEIKDLTFIRNNLRSHGANEIENPAFSVLEGNIAYINVNTCRSKDIDKNISKIQQAKGLIVDLRGYPIFLPTKFLERFLTSTVTDSVYFDYPIYLRPNGNYERPVLPQITKLKASKIKNRLNKNVVFLCNGEAISKTETWLARIKHYKLGVIVGQESAGTNGDMTGFVLKNKYELRFTGALALKEYDKSVFMNNPIQPDVEVKESIESGVYKIDKILEAGKKVIEQNAR